LYTLTVSLVNLKKRGGGLLRVGMFTNATDFNEMNTDNDISFEFKVDKSFPSKFRITKIPRGTYAIALFHDLDGDDNLKQNFLRIPKEPFGHSRNPKLKMRTPRWEECAFTMDRNRQLTINMVEL